MIFLFSTFLQPAHGAYATTQKTLGNWLTEPIVLLCDDQIDILLIKESLDIWSTLGFKSHLRKDTESIACHEEIDGIITIKVLDDLPYSHSGETITRHTWGTREIYGADILIRTGREADKTLITHELGHAFGWGHSEDPRNIMFARISVITEPVYEFSSRSHLEVGVFEEYLKEDETNSAELTGWKKWLRRIAMGS